MSYIGRQPQAGAYSMLDALTASATASYSLQKDGSAFTPESANHLLVSLNGSIQKAGSSYTVSGSTLTFSSALTVSDSIDFILALGDVLDIGTPSDGTITTAKLANTLISGATELTTAPADTDEFLISDAGTLKRIDASLVVGGGKIGQVVAVTKTSTFSTTSTGMTGVTGFTADITPTATSSKVLVIVTCGSFQNDNGNARAFMQVVRGSTNITAGDAATGEEVGSAVCGRSNDGAHHQFPTVISVLDSPNTTSSTTYSVQACRGPDSAGVVNLNRSGSQNADAGNTISTMTLMEVLA